MKIGLTPLGTSFRQLGHVRSGIVKLLGDHNPSDSFNISTQVTKTIVLRELAVSPLPPAAINGREVKAQTWGRSVDFPGGGC